MRAKPTLLRGLQSQPLGSYLAALGVFRVLSQQTETPIRASWSPEGFVLDGVSREDLVAFLVDRYHPTPLVAPWAGGSGFAEGEDTGAIDSIRESTEVRLGGYRRIIEQIRRFPELPPRGLRVCDVVRWAAATASDDKAPKKLRKDLGKLLAALDGTQTDDNGSIEDLKQRHPAAKIFTQMKSQRRAANKAALAARCRNELPDECLGWLDASLVLHVTDDGQIDQTVGPLSKDAMKPKLEFSRLFMQAVCEVVLSKNRDRCTRLAESFITGEPATGLSETAAGLFELGSAGGFNTGPGFESKGLPNNPWKIAMVFEGCVLWSGNVSRRAGAATTNMALVGPFTTRHVAGGVGAFGHANAESALTELWTPLWTRPVSLAELTTLLAEGRARVGGSEPRNAVEFAEAVASLGVDRGITSFVRYAIIERRGPSYMAVPSGTLDVRVRNEADLLRQLDRELPVLDSFLRRFPGDGPPAHLISRRRAIDDARFDVAQRGGPAAMRSLVRAIGALEAALARRDPGRDPKLPRPLGRLGPEWIDACGDEIEVRLAAALASISRTGGAGPLRAYLAPLHPDDPRRYAPSSRVTSWAGTDLSDRLSSVLRRRLLDVHRGADEEWDETGNPTWGKRRASQSDVAMFLAGDLVDESALEELLFGFTWVRASNGGVRSVSVPAPPLPRVYALLRLLFLPDGVAKGSERVIIVPDPAILPLLRVGRVNDAVERASRQLRSNGFRPRCVLDNRAHDAGFGRRLAAALLFPVSGVASLVARALLPAAEPTSSATNDQHGTEGPTHDH
ncbi:MAG: type I-U CRISPR-associated protein Csx17 [Planctomycetota bacterium]